MSIIIIVRFHPRSIPSFGSAEGFIKQGIGFARIEFTVVVEERAYFLKSLRRDDDVFDVRLLILDFQRLPRLLLESPFGFLR